MKQQCISDNRNGSEEGVYLLLFAGSLVALFIIIGAAVDLGNLTLEQFRVQRAVDAAAVTAANYIAVRGRSFVERAADRIVKSNLDTMRVRYDPSTIQVSVNSDLTRIHVEAVANSDLYFLKLIPGYNHAWDVKAVATAERRNVGVSLVLDISGSMGAKTPCNQPGGCQKIAALRNAASSFIDLFDEGRDYMSLTTFNQFVSTPHQMSVLEKAPLKNIVNGLGSGGLTYLTGALREGGQQVRSVPPPLRKAIVVISDGAPTIGEQSCYTSGQDAAKALMIRVLEESDIVRASDDVTLYAIGLGEVSPNADPNDPFQDTTSGGQMFIKPYLLRRVVNDQAASLAAAQGGGDPRFPAMCGVPHYTEAPVVGQSKGLYLQTPNADELEELLVQIGRSIKSRLIE